MTGSRTIQTVLIALLAIPALAALAGCGSDPASQGSTPAEIEFVIESGALARQLRGEAVQLLPEEIDLVAGQSIVIHNRDQALHYFLSAPLWPGETMTKTFDEPGVYRYSGVFTCSIGTNVSLTVTVRDGVSG